MIHFCNVCAWTSGTLKKKFKKRKNIKQNVLERLSKQSHMQSNVTVWNNPSQLCKSQGSILPCIAIINMTPISKSIANQYFSIVTTSVMS